uniref:Uncharacterized protein n=1 Tax=Arion vulgaris TaxID=1028688 RepID=A0A0B6Z093_9EUPU
MGSGSSNQVRSRSVSACGETAQTVCSNNQTTESGYNLKQSENDRILSTTTKNIASFQSETTVHKNSKPIKSQQTSQKSEIISLPSPSHIRKISQRKAKVDFLSKSMHDLHQKIRELELALTISESNKLDLQDQVQTLEDRCSLITEDQLLASTKITDSFKENLKAKDQHIEKLEKDLKNAQIDFQRRVLKWKKRNRGLMKQIFELRQEVSITHMESKAKISQQNDAMDNHHLTTLSSSEDNILPHTEAVSDTSHTKIIVELSTQISEQEEHIARLTAEVNEKTEEIKKLKATLRNARQTPSTVSVDTKSVNSEPLNKSAVSTTNWAHSIREDKHTNTFNATKQMSSFNSYKNKTSSHTEQNNSSNSNVDHKTIFENHSTALSDSDSDWDERSCLSEVYRHSAPARSRVRNYEDKSKQS